MDNQRNPDQGGPPSSRVQKLGQGIPLQPRRSGAIGAYPKPAAGGPGAPTSKPASTVRPIKPDEKPSGVQPARPRPSGVSSAAPQQPASRFGGMPAAEKKVDTRMLRKNGPPAATAASNPPAPPASPARKSGVVPAQTPKGSSSRIARLAGGSSSRLAAAAGQDAPQEKKAETDTLAFKIKFAMIVSVPILVIILVLLIMFGPEATTVEDAVWKEISAEYVDKLTTEFDGIQRFPQEERPPLFTKVLEKFMALAKRAEEHYQKRKSENPDLDLKNMEDFLGNMKKNIEWMSKWNEWGEMSEEVLALFEQYKQAFSPKSPEQRKSALEQMLPSYQELKKKVVDYRDELEKKYNIKTVSFVQEVLDTIDINLRDIESAIEKAQKEIEMAQKAGQGGAGGNELKPPEKRRPEKCDPLKPEEEARVSDAKKAVAKAKELYEDAMRERDQRKRNGILKDACNELRPAFITYRDLWEVYKDKGEGYAFLEYDMDEVRTLDQQFKDKIKTH